MFGWRRSLYWCEWGICPAIWRPAAWNENDGASRTDEGLHAEVSPPVCIVFFQVSYHPDGVGGGREESSSKTTTLQQQDYLQDNGTEKVAGQKSKEGPPHVLLYTIQKCHPLHLLKKTKSNFKYLHTNKILKIKWCHDMIRVSNLSFISSTAKREHLSDCTELRLQRFSCLWTQPETSALTSWACWPSG